MVVVIKWVAHAAFQITGAGKVMYIDLEKQSKPSEKADIVLVTHSHADHCNPSRIKAACKENTVIVAPKHCVSKIGRDVKTLRPGEELEVSGIRIRAVEAYNVKRFRSPGSPYHPKGSGVGYVITVEGQTIYHAGDTDFVPEMQELGEVDVALLPSGDTYTMDNIEAAEAAMAINPRITMPMHRWSTNPEAFREKVESESKIKVVLLQEGEEYPVA